MLGCAKRRAGETLIADKVSKVFPCERVAQSSQVSSGADRAATCVACNGELGQNAYFEHATIQLFACGNCGSLTALPRPRAERQAALHDNAEYFEHPYFELRRRRSRAVERRCNETLAAISMGIDVRDLHGQTHLDIGCDTGAFALAAARIWGTRPCGIDIAARSIESAVDAGVDAYCCPLERAPGHLSALSVITAIDLIEHLVDPQSFIVELKRRLRPGGVAYLETPNITSQLYTIGRLLSRGTAGRPTSVYQRLFPSEHIQYFSRAGLERLASDAGLEIISLRTRRIPFAEIGTSFTLRVAAISAQCFDVITGNAVLLCMVVRRRH
jgi:2-polyprenyl-3-methyl-5-hydroxy-6-metoxy-1,4-benzoquinol methylase